MAESKGWAKARGGVVGYFVLFNVLAALPTPGTPSAERLERPFERAELSRWVAAFHALGIEIGPEQLGRSYLTFAAAAERARALALVPIGWWLSLTQTTQNWRLFGTPDYYVSALRITAYSPGHAEVLYESGDPARRWNASRLEYRRIRAAYNPSRAGPPHTYAGLAERLSEEAFEAMPEVTRVSVALIRRRTPLPGQTPDPARDEAHVLQFTRSTNLSPATATQDGSL